MDQAPLSRRREIITGLAVLIIIVVIVGAVIMSSKKKPSDSLAAAATTAATSTAAPSSNTAASTNYRDGSYTGTGSYDSPGGTEAITIQVSLKNGVVTATSAQSGASDDEAKQYQSQFIAGYQQLVVGKPISSIKLSRVSGSSLTSQGFNEALSQIKQQAQS